MSARQATRVKPEPKEDPIRGVDVEGYERGWSEDYGRPFWLDTSDQTSTWQKPEPKVPGTPVVPKEVRTRFRNHRLPGTLTSHSRDSHLALASTTLRAGRVSDAAVASATFSALSSFFERDSWARCR